MASIKEFLELPGTPVKIDRSETRAAHASKVFSSTTLVHSIIPHHIFSTKFSFPRLAQHDRRGFEIDTYHAAISGGLDSIILYVSARLEN